MALFDYNENEAAKQKAEEKPFLGSDQEVRALITDMSEQSSKVGPESSFESPTENEGFEPSGKLLDQGLEISAEAIVNISDRFLSMAFAKYALDDPEKFYADEEELKNVSRPLEIYFKNNKTNIPPWAVAVFSGVLILFQKFNLAKILREKNIETKQKDLEIERLNREVEILRKTKEINSLKSEVSNLKDDNGHTDQNGTDHRD